MSDASNTVEIGNFGSGVLARLATEFFGDCKVLLSIPEHKADKLARNFMADYGRMMAEDANSEVSYKIGKANKEGMLNLAFAAKQLKPTTATTLSLKIARLCNKIWELRKEGLVSKQSWETLLPSEGENSLYEQLQNLKTL